MSAEENGLLPNKQRNRSARGLLQGTEGRILAGALSLALLYMAFLGLASQLWPSVYPALMGMTATNLIFGRAAGISLGFASGLSSWIVVPANMLVETILVLVFYPLFVFSWNQLLVIPALQRFMDKTRDAAERHNDTIRRYGPVGLFVLVWFPFWMTGPVVGCVIGFLLAMPPLLNLGVVLTGTYVAMISWGFLLRHVHERLAAYNSYAPIIFVVAMIAMITIAHLVHTRRRQQQKLD
jgi:uncharacterized membrane protein